MPPETLAQQHHHYHRLRVARVLEETPDAKSFVLEIPEELRRAFAYQAGQYLTFQIEIGGREYLRCYSLASSPDCESEHKVTVKRIGDGAVSNWLNDRVREGGELLVLPPAGRFVLRASPREMVLFAGGSGITPVISLVKSALVRTARRMLLVYANRDEASIIFRRELDELARRHPDRLTVVHSLDARDGFLTPERVRAALAAYLEAELYLCGPAAFMAVVGEGLARSGIPEERVYRELFASLDEPLEPTAEDSARAASADAGAGACESVRVTLDGKTHELAYTSGSTVLETARAAGLEPPFSCQEGYCSCCMAKLVAGQVAMRKNDCLTQADLDSGWVLTCQSVPQTRSVHVSWDES